MTYSSMVVGLLSVSLLFFFPISGTAFPEANTDDIQKPTQPTPRPRRDAGDSLPLGLPGSSSMASGRPKGPTPTEWPPGSPEHICTRVHYELNQQASEGLLDPSEVDSIVQRCMKFYG